MPAVYPIEWLANTFRGDYPHMAKRDAPVWARWLELYADRFDAFAYDVALGGNTPAESLGTEDERRGWQYVTALKIDAVGLTPTYAWIFEVRPDATVSAVGSVECYALAAVRETLFTVEVAKAIVCETMQPDVEWCCDQLGIRVFKV